MSRLHFCDVGRTRLNRRGQLTSHLASAGKSLGDTARALGGRATRASWSVLAALVTRVDGAYQLACARGRWCNGADATVPRGQNWTGTAGGPVAGRHGIAERHCSAWRQRQQTRTVLIGHECICPLKGGWSVALAFVTAGIARDDCTPLSTRWLVRTARGRRAVGDRWGPLIYF